MSSKFLSGSSFADLTSGTANLNVNSEIIQTLTPGLPMRASASRQLTTGLIQASDSNFPFGDNPATANQDMANFSIINVGNIGGSVKTTAVNDIVSNAGASTNGHVA